MNMWKVAKSLLGSIGNDYRVVGSWARQRPGARRFPWEEACRSDLADGFREGRSGDDLLDRVADFLLIGRKTQRPIVLPPFPGPYTLMARPSLVLAK